MGSEYDPIEDGVKVNVVEGAGNLGDQIDALATSAMSRFLLSTSYLL
ncbi:MAG TPA: hypothetical protein VEB88_05995 [Candidatus Acidoferrales bacterium]|nr:hypothetical protein [Candidatus Acidoferrales bacterium]